MTPMIVNIVSASYSGSTWLNLILGSHSTAFSVGELTPLRRFGKAMCKMHGEACPRWSRFDLQAPQNLYQQIHTLCDKPVMVINNPRQFEARQPDSGFDRRNIHVLRDGRAVCASMMRKFPEVSMWKAAWHWRKVVGKNERRVRSLPAEQRLMVRYEDAVAEPEREIGRICQFLGIAFEPAMLRYWEQDHCFLGGSQGTLHGLAHKRQQQLAEVQRVRAHGQIDQAYYEKQDPEKFVDERWKKELSPRQLKVFRLLAGSVNRRYGYDA